jgi:hypothetical protein
MAVSKVRSPEIIFAPANYTYNNAANGIYFDFSWTPPAGYKVQYVLVRHTANDNWITGLADYNATAQKLYFTGLNHYAGVAISGNYAFTCICEHE